MSQRTVRLKATPIHSLKSLKQERTIVPVNNTIKLVTQTTRISVRRALTSETAKASMENSFELYRCRCAESKTDAQIVCYPHEISNRIPQSWH
jgi:hypothetical protein